MSGDGQVMVGGLGSGMSDESRQHDQETVSRPWRYLLLGIINRAMLDAGRGNEYVSPAARKSACHFLQSQLYRDICDYLGIPPRVAQEEAEKAIHNPRPVRKRRRAKFASRKGPDSKDGK